MSDPVELFLARLGARLDLPAGEREQVLAELRSHLSEKIADRLAVAPGQDETEVKRVVVAEMGAPTELALGYAPGGGVELRDPAGRTVHRFSAAVDRIGEAVEDGARRLGRGTGRFLRGTFLVASVAVALILVSATVLTLALFDDVAGLVRQNTEDLVHRSSDTCDPVPCATAAATVKAFHVNADARDVRFHMDLTTTSAANGTLALRILDAQGDPVYVRTFQSGHEARYVDSLVWRPDAGTWRVETWYDGFAGRLNLQVYVTGIPG